MNQQKRTITFTKDAYFEKLLVDMTNWVGALSAPFIPPRAIPFGEDGLLLAFRDNRPEAVMLGKLVRVVSGTHAAMHLAEIGYVTECGVLLRVISDLCDEIATIGLALHAANDEKPMNSDVKTFVDQYFLPIAHTPDELAAQMKIRYISRESLLRASANLSPAAAGNNPDKFLKLKRFLNKVYDGFVHGYFELTMQLWDSGKKTFEVQGRSDKKVRAEYIESTILIIPQVIVSIEFTALMTDCSEVHQAVRKTRQELVDLGVSGC